MTEHIRSQFDALRAAPTPLDSDAIDALWARLEPVRAAEVLGTWRGTGLDNGHRINRALDHMRWYGKTFNALDDAKPLMCLDEDGNLFSNVELGKGEASLWDVEFRGEVTATMVYDGQPVLDHLKKVDDNTLVGIMNGKPSLVLDEGRHAYFVLERDS